MELKTCRNVLWGIFLGACCLIGLAYCNPVGAQVTVEMGKLQHVHAPMCLTREDMEEVARADSTGGIPAALTLLKAKENCGLGEAMALVKSVTLSLPTERGKTVRVLEIQVDMADGSKVIIYMLSDVEVVGLTKT